MGRDLPRHKERNFADITAGNPIHATELETMRSDCLHIHSAEMETQAQRRGTISEMTSEITEK